MYVHAIDSTHYQRKLHKLYSENGLGNGSYNGQKDDVD